MMCVFIWNLNENMKYLYEFDVCYNLMNMYLIDGHICKTCHCY